MKEFFRKKIVWLKRNPQFFALIAIVVGLIVATFTLNVYSPLLSSIYTDDYANSKNITVPGIVKNPAVYIFIQTLLAILLTFTFLSSYKRGKRNNFMFSLTLVMIVILIACDALYLNSINYFIGDEYGGSSFLDMAKVNKSKVLTIVHLAVCAVAAALALLTPVIKKLLDKIDTSVEDDYDEKMDKKTDEELMLADEA